MVNPHFTREIPCCPQESLIVNLSVRLGRGCPDSSLNWPGAAGCCDPGLARLCPLDAEGCCGRQRAIQGTCAERD